MIVFQSTSSNLVMDDTNGFSDIFLYQVKFGTTMRVNLDSTGSQALYGDSFNPVISGNNRYVYIYISSMTVQIIM